MRKRNGAKSTWKVSKAAAVIAVAAGVSVAACLGYVGAQALMALNSTVVNPEGQHSVRLRVRVSSSSPAADLMKQASTAPRPPPLHGVSIAETIRNEANIRQHWHHDGRTSRSNSNTTARRPVKALVTVFTANIWHITELMLISLAAIADDYDLLIIDDNSTDVTVKSLNEYGIKHIAHDIVKGVTNNWNAAYQYYLDNEYDFLFIVNNDVLVPAGAIEHLKLSLSPEGGGCDLVVPLSTIKGKGGWGDFESVEVIHGAKDRLSSSFLANPLNYQRVQTILDTWHLSHPEQSCDKVLTADPGAFSGFFFGVSRGIASAAFKPRELFNAPAVPVVGQELDLWLRMVKAGSKGCLNTCAFVYHFKGQTIPVNVDRSKWQREPGAAAAVANTLAA